MGLKFFNTKPSFLKLKAILENKTSFGVETIFFKNCLASLLKTCPLKKINFRHIYLSKIYQKINFHGKYHENQVYFKNFEHNFKLDPQQK